MIAWLERLDRLVDWIVSTPVAERLIAWLEWLVDWAVDRLDGHEPRRWG